MDEPAAWRVLVVEDDANHRLLISNAFARRKPSAELQESNSAEEAIAVLMDVRERAEFVGDSTYRPDVIVLDLRMPGIGGLGFLRWHADQEDWVQQVPVIVFTSSDDPELARKCLSLGAREYKEKPADFAELVDVVEGVIGKGTPAPEGDS